MKSDPAGTFLAVPGGIDRGHVAGGVAAQVGRGLRPGPSPALVVVNVNDDVVDDRRDRPGRASAAWTQRSSVKPVGTRKRTYSTTPCAGTVYGSGISKTTSGLPIVHPSGNVFGGRQIRRDRPAAAPARPRPAAWRARGRSGCGRWRNGRSAGRRARGASGGCRPPRGSSPRACARRHRSAARTGRPGPAGGTTGTSPG